MFVIEHARSHLNLKHLFYSNKVTGMRLPSLGTFVGNAVTTYRHASMIIKYDLNRQIITN